jgi:hypothetical protein
VYAGLEDTGRRHFEKTILGLNLRRISHLEILNADISIRTLGYSARLFGPVGKARLVGRNRARAHGGDYFGI